MNTPQTPDELYAQLSKQLADMQKCGELFEHLHKQLSALYFRRYECLKEAGFSDQQAFQIVLNRGIT